MSASRNIHLLVLIHGMWGNPVHLEEMCRIISETKGSKGSGENSTDAELEVLVANSNGGESTYDGIDWGAERVADEVGEKIKELEDSGAKVTKFSIAGYSLGGLVSRYTIGILFQRGVFKNIKPVNFATFATPHIGLLRTSSTWSALLATLGPKLLSRTGEQFYTVDQWGASGRSLLETMADKKSIFYQALSLFAHIKIYGNAVNDVTVPYATALIDYRDPFVDRDETGLTVVFDPKYEPIITSYSIPDSPPSKPPKPMPLSPAWFGSIKPQRLLPPPLQQLKFPMNVMATLFIPILIPAFITFLLTRLTLQSRSSRARIRLLEEDEHSKESALVHVLIKLEQGLEDAVVEMSEAANEDEREEPPQLGHSSEPESSFSSTNTVTEKASNSATKAKVTTASIPASGPISNQGTNPKAGQPILTPGQMAMVESLNALPQLSKHMAFIDPIRNSHATIVSRDVKNFSFHKRGWGVLQHWADGFEL